MLLLRSEVMTASGGQRVGPPVPSGDEKQNGNENRVRRKEKRDLAVRKTQHPGDARRQVVASSTGQNPDYRAERGLRLLNRPSDAGMRGAKDKTGLSQVSSPFLTHRRRASRSLAPILRLPPNGPVELTPTWVVRQERSRGTPPSRQCLGVMQIDHMHEHLLTLTRSSDRFPSTIEPKCSWAALMVVRRCTHPLGRRFR
jgi:hypothetical protein